jgi:hypothetical protein
MQRIKIVLYVSYCKFHTSKQCLLHTWALSLISFQSLDTSEALREWVFSLFISKKFKHKAFRKHLLLSSTFIAVFYRSIFCMYIGLPDGLFSNQKSKSGNPDVHQRVLFHVKSTFTHRIRSFYHEYRTYMCAKLEMSHSSKVNTAEVKPFLWFQVIRLLWLLGNVCKVL